jgi:hypothetical protein
MTPEPTYQINPAAARTPQAVANLALREIIDNQRVSLEYWRGQVAERDKQIAALRGWVEQLKRDLEGQKIATGLNPKGERMLALADEALQASAPQKGATE